jgi:hypothetical protein
VYIADAPYTALPLIGGAPASMHDWANLLRGWEMMGSAATLAAIVSGFGLLLVLVGGGCCVAGLALPGLRERQRERVARERARRRASLPVREPRSKTPLAHNEGAHPGAAGPDIDPDGRTDPFR